jgi:UDP-N-acetylglucosamine 4,6-dehydratase
VFENQTVLITGGTGSFGAAVIPELLKFNLAELRIFSRDEEKQLDLARKYNDKRLRFFLGDVRDSARVQEVCDGVDLVFHAAAQKIIDSCESNPTEALQTNVTGTLNVKKACDFSNVPKAILLSTDKAVKPINLYGMTKGIAERLWVAEPRKTCFSIVRYGNVISSRGSVVPYFRMLVKNNLPLTVTHPEMTRFLLTLKQAMDIVFHVSLLGEAGEIYVPNIPACKIVTLAKAIAGDDYPQRFVGVRQGEKIHECLIHEFEVTHTVKKFGYFAIQPNLQLAPCLTAEFTSDNAQQLTGEELKALLSEAGA